MKKYLLFILIFVNSISYADIKKNGLAKACDDFEKVQSIVTPYLNQAWPGVVATPTGPVPVATNFVLASRQPVTDFCRYMKTMESLDTLGQIEATARYYNTLTDGQNKEDIDFLLETLDVGRAIDNHTNGSGNRNLESVGLHRRINRYLRTSDQYISKKRGKEATTFISKDERRRQAQRMIQSTNKLSNLIEASRCVDTPPGMPDEVIKDYESRIVPYLDLMEEGEEEAKYHVQQLQELGIRMLNMDELKVFQRRILNIYNGYSLVARGKKQTKQVIFQKDSGKVTKKVPYFKYSPRLNSSLIKGFQKEYSKKWESYVKATFTQNIKILTDRESTLNNEIRDLNYECRRSRIEFEVRRQSANLRGLDKSDPQFVAEYEKRIKECKDGVKIKERYQKNLFLAYFNGLLEYLQTVSRSKSIVWSFESKNFGTHRVVSASSIDTGVGEVQETNVSCDNDMNYQDSTFLKVQVENERLEARASMAESITLQTMQEEAAYNKRVRKDEQKKRDEVLEKEIKKRRTRLDYVDIPEAR